MKRRHLSDKAPGKRRTSTSKAALPVLVAAGSGLAVGSAAALELGELQVQSTLGQPLRASIAYALGPDEIIDDRCVAVNSAGGDLPGLHNAAVRVSKGVISITGTAPVMEPMLAANVAINCPYSAHVSRNYLMFIDPQERSALLARRSLATALPAAATARVATTAPGPAAAATPVAVNSRYRVQPGDSLSNIVNRLERLEVTNADAMRAILDANPGAFIDGNPDRLKAGSLLEIPSFASGAPAAVADVADAAPADTPDVVSRAADTRPTANSYQGAEVLEPDAKKQIPATEFLPDVPETATADAAGTAAASSDAAETVVEEPAGETDYSAAYADLVAGDVVIEEPAATDTASAAPAVAPARVVRPGAGTRIVGSPEPAGFSWDWLIWAAVALISAFGSYLMFWPKLRERFGSKPVGADERIPPRAEHAAPITVPESEMTVHEIKPTYDNVDFDLSDDSPTEENLVLDADLLDGTGFDDSGDADLNQQFGFAAPMDLDRELPEMSGMEDASPETDIIPPPERPEDLVV
ncbi:MAG TPA: hypothetical protein VLS87_10580, partial [Woeseiaceae bacterium]|nr:hypothetical protein [Woeseiaceae bacterium]